MKELFALGRNDPCPCGSGRKHKRCCHEAVQRFRAALREGLGPVAAAMPHLLDVLALVCGVRAEAGAAPPPGVEEVAAALRHCHAEMLDPDREPDYGRIVHRLVAVLRQHPELRLLRFSIARLSPLMKEGGPTGPDLLRELATGDFATRAVLAFARAFRAAAGDAQTLQIAAMALYCLLEARDAELVGTAVLRATMEDWEEAQALVLEAGPDLEKEELMEEIWEKYPFLVAEAVNSHRSQAREALRALADGRLSVNMPLYAVLEGIYTARSEVVRALSAGARNPRLLKDELRKTLVRLCHPGGALGQAAASDFPLFAAAARRELTAAAEAADDKLRPAIEALREGLELADVPGFRELYHAFYLGIILRMLDSNYIDVPRRGGPPVAVHLFVLDGRELAEYAAYLDEQGEGEAAARVRQLAALFDRTALTADLRNDLPRGEKQEAPQTQDPF